MDIDICNSLLRLSDLSTQDGLLSTFHNISGILDENAKERRSSSKAALVAGEELSAAEELSEAVDKAKDASLDHLEKECKATCMTAAGRMAGLAYGAIWTAYVIARLARTAAVSAMEAKVSEERAAYAAKTATTALKLTAVNSEADAKRDAIVAKSAAKQASTLAVQAAASALGLFKKLRDSGVSGTEEMNQAIKELEAIEEITKATEGIGRGMVLETECKAKEAEEAARRAECAASAAEALSGTVETTEGAAEGAEKAGPTKERIVNEFLGELDTLKHTNDFLGQSLGSGITVREQLPKAVRKSLSGLESLQECELAEFSRKNRDKSPEELLVGGLEIMRKFGQARTDLTREHLLKLNDFKEFDKLNEFLEGEGEAEPGFLRNDLELRRENLKKRKTLFEKSSKCLFCSAPAESESASGETDPTTDLCLTVKCIYNNNYMKAIVDTGATCNVVSKTWIEKHNFSSPFPEPKRYELLMMGNGAISDKSPCLVGPWIFKDKGAPSTYWKDVEFVVLDGHQGDALLGLPFLKLTQIIHSSTGRLLFAEYEEVSRKEGTPRPIYQGKSPTDSNT